MELRHFSISLVKLEATVGGNCEKRDNSSW